MGIPPTLWVGEERGRKKDKKNYYLEMLLSRGKMFSGRIVITSKRKGWKVVSMSEWWEKRGNEERIQSFLHVSGLCQHASNQSLTP